VGTGRRIYPIGRLDAESTGLLLLTSNGDCLNALLRAEEGKKKVHLLTTSQLLKSQFTEYFVCLLVLLFKYIFTLMLG
jgi:23S rRNA pseudouridine2604 synthase